MRLAALILALASAALAGCAPILMADEARAWGHDMRYFDTDRNVR